MTELRLGRIGAYDETPIASSENLLGTSNFVFSDWQVQTYFSIKDKKPVATFVVTPKKFSREVLFKTDNYEELEKWVNEHLEEINSQVETKKEKWIEEHKDLLCR
jgi:hypothetical protein